MPTDLSINCEYTSVVRLHKILDRALLTRHSKLSKSLYANSKLSLGEHQTDMAEDYIKNVAFVGAGGRSGRFMVEALIKGGRHRVTALTRPDSTNAMPSGLHDIKQVNYDEHQSLVEALKGQEVLIITMNVFAPKESQIRLIDAAVEAGVQWIIPNEWGIDVSKEEAAKDTMLGERIIEVRRYIEKVGAGKMYWTGICNSFWYEFSLAGSEARYGFDFEKKEVTFFNDGETKINHTTFAQVARAVASLLRLRVRPENSSDKSTCLEQYANSAVHISSFYVSQKDVFDSVLRVTRANEKDWTISHEDLRDRYERGVEMSKAGKPAGFVLMLYSRIFYPDGSGDISAKIQNDVLKLPEEDLDEATETAVKMALAGETNMPK